NDQKNVVKNTGTKTPGSVSPANTSGPTILSTSECKSSWNSTVMILINPRTKTTGRRDSNERLTEGGTCGGILIVMFLILQKRYNSTESIATLIATNEPCPCKFDIRKTKPHLSSIVGAIVNRKAAVESCSADNGSRS